MKRRIKLWELLLVVVVTATIIGVGWIAGVSGMDALVLAAGAVVTAVFMIRPLWGVLLFAFTIPMADSVMVGGSVTGTRLLGLLLAVVWVGQKLLRGDSWRSTLDGPFMLSAGAFLGVVLASIWWAQYPTLIPGGFIQLAQLFAWALIVIDVVGSWKRADALAKALVLGALVAAGLTLQQFFLEGYQRAGGGVGGGVNVTAVILLTLMPFGFYLFRSRQNWIWRLTGLTYVAAAVLAIVVTFSRMNMLLLGPVMLVLCLETIRNRHGRAWFLALSAAAVLLGIFVIPWKRLEERAATISPYLEGTVAAGSAEAPEASGRGFHLMVGLAIFRDHPLLGAGYGNYGRLFLDQYQFEVPNAPKVWGTPRSPHSSHIGILADLGLVGALAWFSLLSVVLFNVLRACYLTWKDRGSPGQIFARAATISLLLQIGPYGLYLPNQKDKLFWTLLALSVVVHRLTRGRVWRPEGETAIAETLSGHAINHQYRPIPVGAGTRYEA